MSISRNISKPLPDALWVVWTYRHGVEAGAPMEPENGSYRIYWSMKHVSNYVDSASFVDEAGVEHKLHTRIFEYGRGVQVGGS